MSEAGVRLRTAVQLAALVPACVAGAAQAAPDEMALGKAEGYPVCAPTAQVETRCLVGMVSRRDEVAASRRVARGDTPRDLRRASGEPRFSYRWQGADAGLDDYLRNHRTTGLLILEGDTILAERYQYERNAAHRMTSMSMAKTVVAMLVGVALDEGAIGSLDDRADAYVPELAGTAYGATALRYLLSMSSGVRFSEIYNGSDDVATLARLSLLGASAGGAATVKPFDARERAPGERFHYASAETQVLGLVLRAATGKPLADYLSEKIWKPMGAEADASWLIDQRRLRGGVHGAQRHAARLWPLRAAAGRRRRHWRPAALSRRVGARGDEPAGGALRTRASAGPLWLRLPDVDPARPRAPVRAARRARAVRVRRSRFPRGAGAHGRGRDRQPDRRVAHVVESGLRGTGALNG
jgi:CubicO group peptidase (beta-lactamase class C family)